MKHNYTIVWDGTIKIVNSNIQSDGATTVKQKRSKTVSNKTKYSNSTDTAPYFKYKKIGPKNSRKSRGTATIVVDRK